MKKQITKGISVMALMFLAIFGFAQAKAEYLYRVVFPDSPIYVSEEDTLEAEINIAGGDIAVTVTDNGTAGKLLDSEGGTIQVSSTARGEEAGTMVYTYSDLSEGQYIYLVSPAGVTCSYSFSFEATATGGDGDNLEDAEFIMFDQKYNVPAFTGFLGTFELYSPTTISVLSNAGDLLDESGKELTATKINYGSPNSYVYENLPEGKYYYKLDWLFNTDGTTIEFKLGEVEGGSGDDDDSADIEFGRTYNLDAWEYFSGSFINFDKTTLHVYATNGLSGTLYDGMENEVDLLNTVYGDGYVDYSYEIGSDMYTFTVGAFNNSDGGTLRFVLGDGDDNGDDDNGGFEGVIEFGKTYEIKAGNTFNGSFEVEKDGVVTLTASPAIPNESLNAGGPTSSVTQVGETESTSDGEVAVYDITAGVYNAYFSTDVDMTITYAFEASEDGDGPSTDEPSGDWAEMQFDYTYTTDKESAVLLKYTPATNGTLTATQADSYDPHLFDKEPVYNDEFAWVLNTPMQSDNGYTGDGGAVSPYPLEFVLTAGKTYYFVAKLSPYDDITSVIFTWEPEGEVENVIELDKPQVIKENEVFKFVAPESGILTVNTNQFSTGLAMEPNRQFVFFSNAGCTEAVPALSVTNSAVYEGFAVTFFVEEGTTYYVTSKISQATTFLLELEQVSSIEPELVNIEPLPGRAYDAVNNKYYINMIFSPASATAEKVEISYVNTDNQTVTYESPEYGYSEGAFRIDVRQLTEAIDSKNVKVGSEIKVNLYGVKSVGSYVSKSLVEAGVTLGENGLITLTYVNDNPITLENANLPATLENYGTQQAVLTFSGDVAEVGEVSIVEGTQYWGSEGGGDEAPASVIIPNDNVYIETNTLTIDFTGVDLTSLPLGPITMFVQGVKGTNGLYADINGIAVYQGYMTLVEGSEVPPCRVDHFTPADGDELTIAEDGTATFQVVFTQPAMIELAEAPLGFDVYNCEIEAENPTNGYATTWSVTIPAEYISLVQEEGVNASVNLTVVDEEGNTVVNSQSKLYVVVSFTVPVTALGVDFTVNVKNQIIDDGMIDYFSVEVPEGYDYIAANDYVNSDTGRNEYTAITITDGLTFTAHAVTDGYDEENGIVKFTPAITETGTYTLKIPYNAFTIGTEGGPLGGQGNNEAGVSKASMAKTIEFEVSKTSGLLNIADFRDADNFTVVTINGVVVVRDGKASDLENLQPGLYIINGKKVYITK